MKKIIIICFGFVVFTTNILAQVTKVEGALYDTIYANIEQDDIRLCLLTIIYKDTLEWNDSLAVPIYPIVREQKIAVYQNGIMKYCHSVNIPKKYAYTTNGKRLLYQIIPVIGVSVQQDGDKFFFMADGSENKCGVANEFLGLYSMKGELMYEGYGLGGATININWRKKYGYLKPKTEIDYAFSRKSTIKEINIGNFFYKGHD